eukprot:6198252-Pleurochrysis_carterae.AAC.6
MWPKEAPAPCIEACTRGSGRCVREHRQHVDSLLQIDQCCKLCVRPMVAMESSYCLHLANGGTQKARNTVDDVANGAEAEKDEDVGAATNKLL